MLALRVGGGLFVVLLYVPWYVPTRDIQATTAGRSRPARDRSCWQFLYSSNRFHLCVNVSWNVLAGVTYQ